MYPKPVIANENNSAKRIMVISANYMQPDFV